MELKFERSIENIGKKLLIKILVMFAMMIAFGYFASASVNASTKPVSSSKQQQISIVFGTRNTGQLTSFVYATANPSSSSFRHFLTPDQFASSYGQSSSTINKLKSYLSKYHLKSTVYKGNIVVSVSGSTGNIEKAFKVQLVNETQKGVTFQKATKGPKLPATFSKKMLALTGFFNYSTSTYGKSTQASMQPASFYKRSLDSQGDPADAPQKFIDRYKVSSLYQNGYDGSGKTIGILSFANFHQNDAYHFWSAENIPAKQNRISISKTDGYKGNWSDSDETTMDVEQAGSIAPKANLRVYIAKSDIGGMVDSLANVNSENKVDDLSISWGQSEKQVTADIKAGVTPTKYNDVINLLFKQAAAQGISIFTASGDNGAYDGITQDTSWGLTVDSPGNSPYTVSVGGTTLPNTYRVNGRAYKVTKERAWGSEFLYPDFDRQYFLSSSDKINAYFAGGGGGFSSFNPLPAFQSGISGVGTYDAIKLWNFNKGYPSRVSHPTKTSGTHSGRNVPDISANADPNTGYNMYTTSSSGTKPKWYLSGGTSIVSPQFATVSALISGKANSRLGFWNPQIYRFASSGSSPFTPLDSQTNNTNLYYTGQPGTIYNQATGLGIPDFTSLSDLMAK